MRVDSAKALPTTNGSQEFLSERLQPFFHLRSYSASIPRYLKEIGQISLVLSSTYVAEQQARRNYAN
jgi:hypothetical protein